MTPEEIFNTVLLAAFTLFFLWLVWLAAFSHDPRREKKKRRTTGGSSWFGSDDFSSSDAGDGGGDSGD